MKPLLWLLAGVGLLLFVKYLVFGLTKWDALFHPQRTEPAGSPFLKPWLGIFG
ncbi:MAG: hypothetical protein KGL39_26100 [Patescibacteria group bacterium]|nr:hypothetical protein [Patescibacteria group bacterium]